MKIDILTHGDPEKWKNGGGYYLGGGVGFVAHLIAALRKHDINVIIGAGAPRVNTNIVFLCSMGVDKERNEAGQETSRTKYDYLARAKAPIVVLIHGTDEFRFYKHSLVQLKALPIAAVVITGQSWPILDACAGHFPYINPVVIPMPFHFNGNGFDTHRNTKIIVSPARIGATKGTAKVLDLARAVPRKNWMIRGKIGSGMFWGHCLKDHPHVNGANVDWVGTHIYPDELYNIDHGNAAFAIDLTTFWYKGQLEGERTQYTILEAINAGCIPITFDCWAGGGWDGIFLPSPKKNGARIEWDIEQCAEIIKGAKYDPTIAEENFERLRAKQNYTIVGKAYARLFERVIK